jgi:hypothetical protein
MNLGGSICAVVFSLNHPSFLAFPAGSHHQETNGEHEPEQTTDESAARFSRPSQPSSLVQKVLYFSNFSQARKAA